MKNCSIRVYIDTYPLIINGNVIIGMIDEISSLLQCKYNRLGYSLLHPDYDYMDIGIMLKNNTKSREYFSQMLIPNKYYGKEEPNPEAPVIEFLLCMEENELPTFSVRLEYPVYSNQYLCIKIDMKKEVSKKLTLLDFKQMQSIIVSNGYTINSAFINYYRGNKKRFLLDGIETGIITISDRRVVSNFIKYRKEWKGKIPDIFLMNSVKKEGLSDWAIKDITKILGRENVMEYENQFIFRISQINYELTKNKVKKILQKEKICNKGTSVIEGILKL